MPDDELPSIIFGTSRRKMIKFSRLIRKGDVLVKVEATAADGSRIQFGLRIEQCDTQAWEEAERKLTNA